MDIIEFVEDICGCELTLWQKVYLRKFEDIPPDVRPIWCKGRIVWFKNNEIKEEQETKMKTKAGLKNCKYYNKHLDTIREYIACLYNLDDGNCCTGGLLHIVTDDGNLEDHHIKWCLEECNNHPEAEEAEIGKLICNELLKLPMEQRRLVYEHSWVIDAYCKGPEHCDKCPICNGEEEW